jgi:hypothetical protein
LTFGVLAAVAAAAPAGDQVAPGVLGFLVVAAMGVALVFLLRSMNKQFRKITPEPGSTPAQGEKPKQETPK